MLFFALGIGIILIYYFTVKLSAPLTRISNLLRNDNTSILYNEFEEEVEKLIHENEQMQLELEKQVPVLKTSIFHSLVTGNLYTLNEIEESLMKLQIDPHSSFYIIIIVSFNDLKLNTNLENIVAQKFLLKTIIEENFLEANIYDLDFERFGILIASSAFETQDVKYYCEQKCQEIQKIIENKTGINISFHGDVVYNITKISSGFRHARMLLENEYKILNSAIQWYDEKNNVKTIRQQEIYDIKSRICKYIEENYTDQQLSLSSVADSFGISEVYLSRLFKQSFEQNFSKYVENLRMEEAKKLIESGNYTITAIAQMVGYNSSQTFRRAYKRVYGCTPKEQ